MNQKELTERAERLTKELTDRGLVIEGGWVGLKIHMGLENAPQNQLDDMRKAFYAGALHLFSSIMTILEPGAEPTEKDEKRLSLINDELEKFAHTMAIKVRGGEPKKN